jgi:uncharacterized protein YlaI
MVQDYVFDLPKGRCRLVNGWYHGDTQNGMSHVTVGEEMNMPCVITHMVQCSVCDKFKGADGAYIKLSDEQWKDLKKRTVTIHHKICPECHREAMSICNRFQGICED